MEDRADSPAVRPQIRRSELLLLLIAIVIVLLLTIVALRWANQREAEAREQRERLELENGPIVTALLDESEEALERKDIRGAIKAFNAASAIRISGGLLSGRIQHVWVKLNRVSNELNERINTAKALSKKNDLEGAISQYRESAELDTWDPYIRTLLSFELADDGQWNDAIEVAREAVKLGPNDADAHVALAYVLGLRGEAKEAAEQYRETIRLDPKKFGAVANLGILLTEFGEFEEAIATLKEAARLAPDSDPWIQEHLAVAKRLHALEPNLPAFLAGGIDPESAQETADYALLCMITKSAANASLAELFDTAFRDDPKLADNLQAMYRYKAAWTAVVAGRGEVDDGLSLADYKELRDNARGWLRDEMKYWSTLAHSKSANDRRRSAVFLRFLLNNPTFASTRPGFLRIGMTTAERAEWDSFWSDVKATLREARRSLP